MLLAVGCSLIVMGVGSSEGGQAQQGAVSIEVIEAVGVADAQQALPPVAADVTEGALVSDAVMVLPPASILVAEAVGVTDSQQTLPPAIVEVAEAIGVADALGDSDQDGTVDLDDNCAVTPNGNQADSDADGVGSSCDNCPASANGPGQRFSLGAGNQTDSDGDGLPGTQPPFDGIFGGDACDVDDDNDGVADSHDAFCRTLPEDYDGFQDGDGCPDSDNDLDGVCDTGQSSVACAGSDFGKFCFDPAGTLFCHTAPATDCRNVTEDIDGFKDGDGCPEPDNDNDGFTDVVDQCPGVDWQTGLDGMFGAPQDVNHNGVKDGSEALFTTDDILLAFEDRDGVLDTDGCHDSPGEDFDGDGYTDDDEALKIGTNPGYPCGVTAWPSDVYSQGLSLNELDVQDIISFIAPVRHLDKSPPNAAYSARWDLKPGATSPFPSYISIYDITTMVNGVAGSPAYPPMFDGPRAFGRACPLSAQ